MALVSYSDSEASDTETPAPPQPTTNTTKPKLVDSSNPRKIRVALPELQPEVSSHEREDGPARKKARVGGGAFSGFNALLPAPKKVVAAEEKKGAAGRKAFSLKTGATPGFDRGLDAEMKSEMAFEGLGGEGVEDIPKAGSLRDDGDEDEGGLVPAKKTEEVKLKGNPMMFKPLSVGRATQKKKKAVPPAPAASSPALSQTVKEQVSEPAPEVSAPKPKPKVSLFSLGSGDSATDTASAPQSAAYEPVVYTSNTDAPAAGPEPEQGAQAAAVPSEPTGQTLDSIADDLNLSRSQRRHLFGRQADPSKSRIIHFNTDKEYVANQELAHQTDLAAAQHNPVRSIAPGKHSLQQLVNAASSQREALEESFASGRRNKKEAGSKYGW